MKLKVIYEDNHLLVCEKPVNVPVQADSSGDLDLLTIAKAYIKEKYNKPGDAYLGLVHRLDRPVGGVMVFARTSKAADRLTQSFKKRTTEKKYAAVVIGNPPDYNHLNDYLLRDEASNRVSVVTKDIAGAKEASLDFAAIARKNGLNLLDVSLHSGRHHQIRVQLSNALYPIYGDQRYNPSAKVGQQIALYAYALTIDHPTLKTQMRFTSIPHGGVWDDFRHELSALSWGVRIKYIDENIIIVNKQAGMSCVQSDESNRENERASIEKLLKCALNTDEIYPVHRLDVMTAGLLIFARNKPTEAELKRLIKNRLITKTYHARVFGVPSKPKGRLVLYAAKDSDNAYMVVKDNPFENSVEMITDYKIIDYTDDGCILEIRLITGRTHQIRASLAHIGTPVVGDDKYGDRAGNKKYKRDLMLCATKIEFPEMGEKYKALSNFVIENQAEFEMKNE